MYTQDGYGYSDSLGLYRPGSAMLSGGTASGGMSLDTMTASNIFNKNLIGVGGAPNADLSFSQLTSSLPVGTTSSPTNSLYQGSAAGSGAGLLTQSGSNSLLAMYLKYANYLQQIKANNDDTQTCDDNDIAEIKRRTGFSDDAVKKLLNTCEKVKCKPDDLLAIMKSESGYKPTAFNDAKNPKTGKSTDATGLIQITRSTAKRLGTTVEELKKMSAEEQMDYVEKYLMLAKKDAKMSDDKKLSGGELYALVFMPAKASKDVLTQKGDTAYEGNSSLDKNKDGKITIADLDRRMAEMQA